jgi:hypothetical protein
MVRDPPRAVVDVEPLVELAGLAVADQVGVLEALAGRLAAAAGEGPGLDDLHLVAGLGQFVGGGHAGQARAQHHDLGPLGIALQLGRSGLGRRETETQGVHAGHGQRHPAEGRQTLEKPPPRQYATRRRRRLITHTVPDFSCREGRLRTRRSPRVCQTTPFEQQCEKLVRLMRKRLGATPLGAHGDRLVRRAGDVKFHSRKRDLTNGKTIRRNALTQMQKSRARGPAFPWSGSRTADQKV